MFIFCTLFHPPFVGEPTGDHTTNSQKLFLKVKGNSALGVWNAPIDGHKGSADRHYCKHCGTPLWVSDEQWPELVHPFASAIDTELPQAPSSVHLLLRDKASWVETADRPQ